MADGGQCPAPVRPREAPVRMGDIVRAFGDALRETSALRSAQHEVLTALARCRTAALGGHLAVCDHCGHATPVDNSCRNRHCPTCQGLDQHRWIEARRERILPTRYFHVVFTLPEALRAIVRHNRTALFAMLFQAASQTLLALAHDPRRLGALPAITMVLHTVDAGAALPSPPPRGGERGRPLARRRALGADEGRLPLPGEGDREALPRVCCARRWSRPSRQAPSRCRRTADPTCSMSFVRRSTARTGWSTRRRPSAAPSRCTRTAGRYTHRVGISNARIRTMDERGVTFATKGGRECTLSGVEFLRRFVDHVLPKGFTRIRHYGLLAPCHATTTLERAPRSTVRQPSSHRDD